MKTQMILVILIISLSNIFAQSKKALVEIQTNSHCVLCPSAHAALDSYLQSGQFKDNIVYMYYHMTFPYSDDKLNQDNTIDPAVRNNFYGAVSSTPRGIFNGQVQNNNYAGWATVLNSIGSQLTSFELKLSGSSSGNNLTVNAMVKQTSTIQNNNLSIFFVVVETVNYQGRNGINPHKNVVRKMFPNASGKSFFITQNQSIIISENVIINNEWNKNQLGIVVFIQNLTTKEVYQSEYLSYNQLIATNVEGFNLLPSKYQLFQNYPNPFNPTTVIDYQLSVNGFVTLKVYDLLGREIETLVNEYQSAGKHSALFTINSSLSSGVYIYRLQCNGYKESKKMVLMK